MKSGTQKLRKRRNALSSPRSQAPAWECACLRGSSLVGVASLWRSRLLLPLICAATLTAWAAPDPALPTDAEVKARESALQVAGAFSNDGFKSRDGHAFFKISQKEPKFIKVNLYSGNQYWFIAAAASPAKKIAVTIYDEKGKYVPTEPYENNLQAAAGFSPQLSGPYIVRIQELEGEPATACLLYSYK